MGPLRSVFLGYMVVALSASPGHWAKPGVSKEEAAAEYRLCAQQAERALARDRAIDHDILAARQLDWERAGVLRLEIDQMRHNAAAHAQAILDSCMREKGFVLQPY
jgi:hypothetical protein